MAQGLFPHDVSTSKEVFHPRNCRGIPTIHVEKLKELVIQQDKQLNINQRKYYKVKSERDLRTTKSKESITKSNQIDITKGMTEIVLVEKDTIQGAINTKTGSLQSISEPWNDKTLRSESI